jgi:hypothetical protein
VSFPWVNRVNVRAERLLFLAYVGLTLYFTAPLVATGNQLGVEDWDILLFYHASVIKSVYEYGRLPFWNPWYCAGDVLWQNPQVALLSPVYLFSLMVSLPLAMKLNIVLHYLVGFFGMHVLLTRAFKLSYLPGVLFLSCLFTLAGGPAFHLEVGHATFLSYFYLPWVLFFFLRAIEGGKLRDAVATAAIIAVAIYNGGIYITFMTGLGLGCFSLASSVLRRDWRPLALVATVGALAFLFAAPKLLPVAAFAGDARIVDMRAIPPGPDAMGRDMLLHAFLDPYQYRRLRLEGQVYAWHEYANYIGSLGALLVVATFAWIMVRRPWRREHWLRASLALTALALLLLSLGEFGPYAPYGLLRRLPIVSQLRIPSRYSLIFLLFATAMVASVWKTMVVERADDAGRFAAIVLILSSFALAYWNHIQFEGVFSLAPLESSFRWLGRPAEPIVDETSDVTAVQNSLLLRSIMENRAIVRCSEPLQLPGAIDATRPAVFAEDHAQIGDIEFAPGRIRFRALARGSAGRVFLNERYVEGWHSDAGDFTLDPQTGLAYVTLPAGTTGRFAFWFRPPRLDLGLILLAAGSLLSVLVWRRTLAPPAGMTGHDAGAVLDA